nr:hypothetical protein OG409_37715 [Streptomyces sp. NBC_00974]
MTARCLRTALLLVAVPLTAATVAVVLRAGRLKFHADWHRIEITAQPPAARTATVGAAGGPGSLPREEARGCWPHRRELRIRLLSVPAWDEPRF